MTSRERRITARVARLTRTVAREGAGLAGDIAWGIARVLVVLVLAVVVYVFGVLLTGGTVGLPW